MATDLNRDIPWEAMWKYGMAGAATVSVDNVWSAIRFRLEEKLGKQAHGERRPMGGTDRENRHTAKAGRGPPAVIVRCNDFWGRR
ncbi:MAG: hypothetical protein HY673_25330 [Chloroflexi bacterium]|nr:hypothetical protein [Chloroflexota bacterium]